MESHAASRCQWHSAQTVCLLTVLMCGARGIVADQPDPAYMTESAVVKRALVIGVEAYENAPKVINATNDALGIAKNLRQLGFQTQAVTGPAATTRAALLDAISHHVGSLKQDEISVIY